MTERQFGFALVPGLMSSNPFVIWALLLGALVAVLMAVRGGRGSGGRRT